MINLEKYLAVVSAYIRRDGYVKSAYENPTWKVAQVRCETPEKSDNITITREDEEIARDTIFYFLHDTSNNDYVNKVRNILQDVINNGKLLETKMLPFVASAVQSFLKNKDYKKRKEEAAEQNRREAMRSDYVGDIGEKVTFEVAKMTYKLIDGPYGESILYKFTDPLGNIFIWFTGKDVPDNVREISGTVKDHKEFQGVKQTILTRCKFK